MTSAFNVIFSAVVNEIGVSSVPSALSGVIDFSPSAFETVTSYAGIGVATGLMNCVLCTLLMVYSS